MDFITTESLTALLQIIMIDLVLAGDNAIVIGLAAAGLPKDQRTKAILIGIIAAKARFASPPPAASASVSARGVICQERPQRSLHQLH